MDHAPSMWYWVSGLCFGFSLLLDVVLIGAIIWIIGTVKPLIQDLKQKIDQISGKVDNIAGDVNHITTSVKGTVDTIHTRTTQILGSAEEASAEVTRKVSAASAAITAIFVVTRLVGALRGMSHTAQRDGARTKPTRVKLVKR